MLLLRRLRVAGCMMRNTASVAAGAPQTASSTYAGWWSSPEPMLLPCMLPLWTSARPLIFDSVNHKALWEVLEARGIHPKLISLIKDLYKGNRVRVAAGGARGRLHTHWRKAGLPPISPPVQHLHGLPGPPGH